MNRSLRLLSLLVLGLIAMPGRGETPAPSPWQEGVDQDEATVRDFIAKNQMTWPQVWDKDHAFTSKCQVNRFPTYVLVSHEGEILYSVSGWGEGIEQDLRAKIASAVRAAKKNAKPEVVTTR